MDSGKSKKVENRVKIKVENNPDLIYDSAKLQGLFPAIHAEDEPLFHSNDISINPTFYNDTPMRSLEQKEALKNGKNRSDDGSEGYFVSAKPF